MADSTPSSCPSNVLFKSVRSPIPSPSHSPTLYFKEVVDEACSWTKDDPITQEEPIAIPPKVLQNSSMMTDIFEWEQWLFIEDKHEESSFDLGQLVNDGLVMHQWMIYWRGLLLPLHEKINAFQKANPMSPITKLPDDHPLRCIIERMVARDKKVS